MRFSLISLLVFTALIAIVCGIFFALPDVISLLALTILTFSVIPASSVSGIVFGQGKARAFCIGVLSSTAWTGIAGFLFGIFGGMASIASSTEGVLIWKIIFAIIYFTSVLCGGIAVGIRWLCLRGVNPTSAANSQPSPTMVIIDPRDKAELYAILQGRMTSRIDAATNGLHSPLSSTEYDAVQR
jgi:hypothetical protein